MHTHSHLGAIIVVSPPTGMLLGGGKETGEPGGNPRIWKNVKFHTESNLSSGSNTGPWRCNRIRLYSQAVMWLFISFEGLGFFFPLPFSQQQPCTNRNNLSVFIQSMCVCVCVGGDNHLQAAPVWWYDFIRGAEQVSGPWWRLALAEIQTWHQLPWWKGLFWGVRGEKGQPDYY